MDRCKKVLSSFYQACLPVLARIWQVIKQYRSIAVGLITVTVIIVAAIIGLNTVKEELPVITVTDISVSEISYDSAVISWFTSEPSISRVIIYDSGGIYIREQIDIEPVMEHKTAIAGLSEETGYYYEISTSIDDIPEDVLTRQNYFETGSSVVEPLNISDVRVSVSTDSNIRITWNTDRDSSSVLEYWPANYPQLTEKVVVEIEETEHSAVLSGLSPETVYSIRLTANGVDGATDIAEFNNYFSISSGLQPGMIAPDFSLNTLGGELITLSDYRGKVVLLDFWVWTCSACREKLPMIEEIYNSVSSEDIAVLGIHYQGKISVVENVLLNEGVSFFVLMDDEAAITKQYDIETFPTVIIIDRDGFIRVNKPEFQNIEELRKILKNVMNPE
jgi:peroxiredoxin